MAEKTEMEITIEGNPAKPQGKAGEQMLERMNSSHNELTKWALGFLNVTRNAALLDIGCGGGATLKKLCALTDNKVFGVDYSKVSVEKSKRLNLKDIESGKLKVLEASVSSLPFENDSFEGITTIESFYFWNNQAEDLKEVFRVLKKGGTFLIVADIYNKEGLSEQTKQNIKRFKLFNPTPEEFKSLLHNAGFKNVKIHLKEGTDWICAEAKK